MGPKGMAIVGGNGSGKPLLEDLGDKINDMYDYII